MKLKKFENYSEDSLEKVKIVRDDSSHWYVIPNDLLEDFHNDVEDEQLGDSGEFDKRYGKYRGGLNGIQLYAKL